MTYAYPANFTSPADMMDWANAVTFNSWGMFTLIIAWAALFFVLKERFDGLRATVGATFPIALTSIFFRTAAWIPDWFMYLMIITAAISIALLYKEEG